MVRKLFNVKKLFVFLMLFYFLIYPVTIFAKETDKNTENKIDFNKDIPVVTVSELKKKISEHRDKVLIVDFWATWCPPCKDEIPGFISLYGKYKNKGVEIIGVALDMEGNRTVKPFAKRMGINYPLYIGGYEINEAYEIAGIPTTLIFNKDGKLKIKHVGYASEKEFEDEILKLLQ